jgi:hypothetical protein
MVSEKIIVVLLVIAIVMSVVSVVVTFSMLNDNMVPTEFKVKGPLNKDDDQGRVSIIIEPPITEGG